MPIEPLFLTTNLLPRFPVPFGHPQRCLSREALKHNGLEVRIVPGEAREEGGPRSHRRRKQVHWFPEAAVTKHNKLGDLKNRNLFSHSYGGWISKIKVLKELVPYLLPSVSQTMKKKPQPSEDCEGESILCLSAASSGLMHSMAC